MRNGFAARALKRIVRPALLSALVLSATGVMAQNNQGRPIRIIVPYAAGGAIDATARMLAEPMTSLLGQPVIIENRTGASGKIAAEYVSRAEPDGNTMLYTAGADLALLQARTGTAEAIRALTPITSAVAPVGAVATRPDLGISSMEYLLKYMKANPGKLSHGSTGFGSSQHLIGEYFRQSGYDMLHVPFNGIAPVMQALSGGHIDIALTNMATSFSLAADGKIKILAVPQSEPFEDAPDIPPITKAMPDYVFKQPIAFYGFYGPPGLPRPIASKLADAIGKAVSTPQTKAKLKTMYIVPMVSSPDEFAAMLKDVAAAFEKIIKTGDIKLD